MSITVDDGEGRTEQFPDYAKVTFTVGQTTIRVTHEGGWIELRADSDLNLGLDAGNVVAVTTLRDVLGGE